METSLRYGGDSKALRIHAKEKVPIDSNTFFQVHGELDTRVGQASSLSAQIKHFYPSLSATLGVGLRYDKHEKLCYTEGLVEIREDYIEDSHKGETKSASFIDALAPAELEGILMSHPSIEDAAVVPQKDDIAGEVPVAFVVQELKLEPLRDVNLFGPWLNKQSATAGVAPLTSHNNSIMLE